MDNLQGQIIKGYELRELIGAGGFGAVYRAYQSSVDRDVAIKVILPQLANQASFIRRFEIEAQMVAHLEHPYVVPLYDYWREPDGAYLVMRWLPSNLRNELKNGSWTIDATARMLDQVASALAVAHRHDVIHRDIKPDNILLDDDNNAYLADFGIAKSPAKESELTQEGMVVGSLAYITPEQIRSESVSPQTDIYSLGIVLYEILTGEQPFPDTMKPGSLIFKHLNEPLPSIRFKRPDLSHLVDEVIQHATAKDLHQRYPDVLCMASAFRQALPTGSSIVAGHTTTPDVVSSYQTIIGNDIELENPYKGLRAFRETDAADFFGRDALIKQLLDRMAESTRFLAVVGPSGSGKSSVVRAGLLPALRQGQLPGSNKWFFVEMTPNTHPFEELEVALLRIAVNPPTSLQQQLQADNRGLLRAVRRVLPDDKAQLVLFIDQFEELFTLVEDETVRVHLIDSLVTAVCDPMSPLRIVITLRADFYDKPLLYPQFGDLIRKRTEVVLPLSPEELRQAIVKPAERAGVTLDPALIAAIIKDIGEQPGALPLLQYALTELFECREGTRLTLNAYRESGGVFKALGLRAEDIFTGFDSARQQATRQVFLRMVTLGEGVEDTRRRVQRKELISIGNVDPQTIDEIVNTYAKYRLLTLDRDPATRSPTVEVAHEALIRTWSRLREWLDESREDLRVQRRLMTAAADWGNADCDPSFLATGTRLTQFEGLAGGSKLILNEQEQAYLRASILERGRQAAHEREQQAKELKLAQEAATAHRQAANRLRYLAGAMAIFLGVSLGLALFAFSSQKQALSNAATATFAEGEAIAQANNARTQAAIAQENLARSDSLRLVAEANGILQKADGNIELAALLGLRALKSASLPQAESVILRSAIRAYTRLTIEGHTDEVTSVAFSPDGRYILSASADQTARLWEASTGKPIRTYAGHTDKVVQAVFSPDGKFIFTSSYDKTGRLWDVETGQMIRTFDAPDRLTSAAYSPDGHYIVTGCKDQTAQIWEVATGKIVHVLSGHIDTVEAVAYSPDGRYVLTGSEVEDKTARLWDAQTGDLLYIFTGHTDSVLAVAFSPDGRYALTGGWDKTARMWEVATGKSVHVFPGHTYEVRHVAFTSNNRYALTSSNDGVVRLWDVTTGDLTRILSGHSAGVGSAVFSPDSRYVLTGSRDKTIRLWTIESDNLIRTFEGHTDEIVGATFSRDGRYALTNSKDKTSRIWDTATGQEIRKFAAYTQVIFSHDGRYILAGSIYDDPKDAAAHLLDATTGQEIRTFKGHSDPVRAVAFSPDGRYIFTSGIDKTAKMWDAETAHEIRTFSGHTDKVWSLDVSPDGRYLLTSSKDKTARLWEIETGKVVYTFSEHTDVVTNAAFSPDGRYIVTSSGDQTARLWDATTGSSLRIFSGHTDYIETAVFSPDGRYLLTASDDQTARLWLVGTGDLLQTFSGQTGEMVSVAFSPDGRYILTANTDKTIKLWLADYRNPLQFACTHVYRDLTSEERVRYNISERDATCPQSVPGPQVVLPTWTPFPTPTLAVWTPIPLTPLPTATGEAIEESQ